MNISAAKHPASVRQDRTALVQVYILIWLIGWTCWTNQWSSRWPKMKYPAAAVAKAPLMEWAEKTEVSIPASLSTNRANLSPSVTTLGHVALHEIYRNNLLGLLEPSLKLAICLPYSLRHETTQNELSWRKLPKNNLERRAPGVLFFMRIGRMNVTPFGEILLSLWLMAATSND